MANMWILLKILGLITVLLFIQTSDACTCMPEHPQSQYCNSEYVIIARILRKSARRINNNDVYKIDIKKSYKMSERAKHLLKDGRLKTPSSDSMCGIKLNIGKLYLISARDIQLNICNYVKEYSKMTIVERRGFAGGYKKGCLCDIQKEFGRSHHSYLPMGTCKWYPFSKCETDYGACVPSRGLMTPDGKPVKCHWRQSPPYNACLAEP